MALGASGQGAGVRAPQTPTIEGIDRLACQLEQSAGFAFDFETVFLDWHHKDFHATAVSFSWDGVSSYVVIFSHAEYHMSSSVKKYFYHRLRSVMQNKSVPKIVWNAMFDAPVFFRESGYLPYISHDAMVISHLLDENQPRGLKWNGRAHLLWDDWDIETTKKSGQGTSIEELSLYCGCDSAATFLLWQRFMKQLQADEVLGAYYRGLEAPKIRALLNMVVRGIHVDTKRLGAQWLKARQNWLEAKEKIPVTNPASADQVAKWLYSPEPDGLGLVPIKFGKKRGSTDEESINRLAQTHPEVRVILPVRKWARYEHTYFKVIAETVAAAFDRRYHPDIRTTGTATGRLASPFHTIPRPTPEDGAFVRSIFTAPEGYTLLEADLSQVEARFCAWAAAGKPKSWAEVDPERARMLIAFHESRNIYAEQAAQNIYGSPARWQQITYHERQIMGKVPVLAMLYRISPQGLKDYAWKEYQVDWSMKQATKVWLGFHKLWPEFRKWHEREERALRLMGLAISPLGRRRRLPAAQQYGKVASEAIQQGINSPVQSVASDWTQAALVIAEKLGLRVVGDVHDALLVDVPTKDVERAARMMKWVMEEAAAKYLERLGLVLPEGLIKVEVKAGNWGESTLIL